MTSESLSARQTVVERRAVPGAAGARVTPGCTRVRATILPTLLSVFAAAMLVLPVRSIADGPPGATVVNGQKVLTLIGRDPPGVRCNNNMQVAAELANIYKIPVQVIPVSFAGPGARAPAVYYGKEVIAIDGGELNGMVSYAQIEAIFEVEGVPKQATQGRLSEVRSDFDRLKAAIKAP